MRARELRRIPRMPAKAIRVRLERLCDGGLGHHGVRGGVFLAVGVCIGDAGTCGRRGIGEMHGFDFDRVSGVIHAFFWDLA